MKIKESAENYLETILMLKKEHGYVRSVDIAHHLSYTKASVSVAMKSFREEGYIVVDADGNISLTEKGLEIAEKMYERHKVIAKGLIALGEYCAGEIGERTMRLASGAGHDALCFPFSVLAGGQLCQSVQNLVQLENFIVSVFTCFHGK